MYPYLINNYCAHWTYSCVSIDPFHMRHSIAVTVVMCHMTYEQWEVKQEN